MLITTFLDKLALFAHERYPEDMAATRAEYFEKVGIVHESDELHEENLKAFLDWYLFEHPVEDSEKTPLSVFLEEVAPTLPEEEAAVYRGFTGSRHGMFQVMKAQGDHVDCRELFTDERFHVREETISGFLKGEIFEARVLPFHGDFHFGDVFRFHPRQAEKIIKKTVRAARDGPDAAAREIMMRLAACKVKHHRFPRIDLVEFYKEKS